MTVANFYEFKKRDLGSDTGYCVILVQAHNIIRAMRAVNIHLSLMGREDLETHDSDDFKKLTICDGVIYSNVQRKVEEDGREEGDWQDQAESEP